MMRMGMRVRGMYQVHGAEPDAKPSGRVVVPHSLLLQILLQAMMSSSQDTVNILPCIVQIHIL